MTRSSKDRAAGATHALSALAATFAIAASTLAAEAPSPGTARLYGSVIEAFTARPLANATVTADRPRRVQEPSQSLPLLPSFGIRFRF